MNAQNTQSLQNCVQTEVLYLCESRVDRLLARAIKLIRGVRNFYERQTLTRFFIRQSPALLRDIGLDDPRAQIRLFNRNFNSVASLGELDRNRLHIR